MSASEPPCGSRSPTASPSESSSSTATSPRGLDYLQHSCGDNRPIIDMLAEAGVDCLQSLQPQTGMTPESVKRLSGNRIAGWGGVDLHTLISGTPDDVRREVFAMSWAGLSSPADLRVGASVPDARRLPFVGALAANNLAGVVGASPTITVVRSVM